MLQYFDELKCFIEKYGFDIDDFMIVGSGTLSVIGGRSNGDIEFSLSPRGLRKLPLSKRSRLLFVDHIDLSENVDLFKNRYLCIGLTDQIIFEKKLLYKFEGFNIVIPEIELAYKHEKKRPKDVRDFEQIHTNEALESRINWEQYHSIIESDVPRKYLNYERFRGMCWWYPHLIKSKLLKIGGGGYLSKEIILFLISDAICFEGQVA